MRLAMPTARATAERLSRESILQTSAVWLSIRVALAGFVALVYWQEFLQGPLVDTFAAKWAFQEFDWYQSIATNGYAPPGEHRHNAAYFPGTALLMAAGALVGSTPAITGMVAALAGGLAAALALAALAPRFASKALWAVLALALAPLSVFLSAPWSEGPFVGLSFWAWACAVRKNWIWAGVLAGLATVVRVNGLFLMAALIVLLVSTDRGQWKRGAALLLPAVVVGGHFAYLHSITGSWTAWRDAMRNFGRNFVDPVTSLGNTIALLTDYVPGTVSSRFVIELLTAGALIATVVILVMWRYWGEATYVGLTAISLMTADFYQALPRSLLVLFPVWLIIGRWMTVSRTLRWAYLIAAPPMLLMTTYLFSQRQWIS